MKSSIISCLLATALLAACTPKSGNTTKVVGQFTENAPETASFVIDYVTADGGIT